MLITRHLFFHLFIVHYYYIITLHYTNLLFFFINFNFSWPCLQDFKVHLFSTLHSYATLSILWYGYYSRSDILFKTACKDWHGMWPKDTVFIKGQSVSKGRQHYGNNTRLCPSTWKPWLQQFFVGCPGCILVDMQHT